MDKLLIVVGGGVLQEKTFEETKKQGLKTLLIDGAEDCWCRSLTDYFILNSTKRLGTNVSKVEEFLKEHPELNLVGVYTQGTDVAVTVACLASAFGKSGIPFEVAMRTNNKILMREAFEMCGIPQPQFSANKTDFFSFPFVIKSVDNCASRGLTIVRNADEIPQAVENAKKFSSNKEYISEDFIDGKEYSVDTVVYKGVVYPAGISDRIFLDKDNYAIQDGSITPSFLPSETQEKMYALMQRCASALGVTQGAFKGDLIVDTEGQILPLEVAARLSGGFDSQWRKPLSFGINLIKATIDLACGKELDFADLIPKWSKFSQTFTVFPKPGIIKEIKGLEELRNLPGIKFFALTKHVGELVEYKTCADRVIHIIAVADTYEQLQEAIKKTRQTVEFITE